MIHFWLLLILLIQTILLISILTCISMIINYPNLKISKWIKKHIITNEDLDLPNK
jgi:hypothetical protein